MDQSISVYGKRGTACLVHFKPSLRIEDVCLPESAVLVVANCLKVADKVVSADICYNLRLCETRIAAAILSEKIGGPLRNGDVVLYDVWQKSTGYSICLEIVESCFKEEGHTLNEAAKMLNMNLEQLVSKYFSELGVLPKILQLYKRAKHVYSEAERVNMFAELAGRGDLVGMGKLMNQSQESCSDLFDCSCQELDELVQSCR
jgi:galactokinase